MFPYGRFEMNSLKIGLIVNTAHNEKSSMKICTLEIVLILAKIILSSGSFAIALKVNFNFFSQISSLFPYSHHHLKNSHLS